MGIETTWIVRGPAPGRGKGRRLFVECLDCHEVFDRPACSVARTRRCMKCSNAIFNPSVPAPPKRDPKPTE